MFYFLKLKKYRQAPNFHLVPKFVISFSHFFTSLGYISLLFVFQVYIRSHKIYNMSYEPSQNDSKLQSFLLKTSLFHINKKKHFPSFRRSFFYSCSVQKKCKYQNKTFPFLYSEFKGISNIYFHFHETLNSFRDESLFRFDRFDIKYTGCFLVAGIQQDFSRNSCWNKTAQISGVKIFEFWKNVIK